jgi:hypothetical protein
MNNDFGHVERQRQQALAIAERLDDGLGAARGRTTLSPRSSASLAMRKPKPRDAR